VKRDKQKLLKSILERSCSDEEKVNRILSLDAELKNEDICNYTIDNNGSLEDSVCQIIQLFQ
jgi:guanylate kinase